MRLLLDTQIVYWSNYEPEKLPRKAREMILAADANYVSAATIWEMAIKVKLGKLKADPERILAAFEASGSIELPVLSRHAAKVATLPLYHGDPFDRMLVAQAMSEQMRLLTTDLKLPQYSDLVVCV